MYKFLYMISCIAIMVLIVLGGVFFSVEGGKYASAIFLIATIPTFALWVVPFLATYFVRKQKQREIRKGGMKDD